MPALARDRRGDQGAVGDHVIDQAVQVGGQQLDGGSCGGMRCETPRICRGSPPPVNNRTRRIGNQPT